MNTDLMSALLEKLCHPIEPPGCTSDFIAHPSGRNEAVEVGVVLQHRFAFFYWLKWHAQRRADSPPPNLLTLDWHDDVGGNCDFNPETLARLNPGDANELSLFCWAGLRSLNDGHIAPAQYLNAIGDVYVVLKQRAAGRAMYEHNRRRVQKDASGTAHRIHYYSTPEEFLEEHGDDAKHPLLLDIDLDFFTTQADSGERGARKRVSDRAIRKVVGPDGPLMAWALPRLGGLTIALEPKYCGGVRNCAHILDVISSTLCDPPLLTAGMAWRVVGRR